MHPFRIRPEHPEDRAGIRRAHEQAFAPDTNAPVGAFVDALRDSGHYRPELCLVAVDEQGEVLGHIAYSEASLDSLDTVLALAPLAVAPAHHGAGVGGALVRESLRLAARSAYPLVVVLGHPGYYPRFGFVPGERLGVRHPHVSGAAWMAYPLPAYRQQVRGTVIYPEAFKLLD